MTSYVPLIESVPVLSSLYENVYANEENMRKSISPVINAQTFKLNLPTSQMGTQIAVDLPLGPLLGTTILALNLGKSLPVKAGLQQGWGFRAIGRYIVQLDGGSPLTYFGQHVLISHMAACETGEKRNTMLSLAGPQYDGITQPTSDLIAYIPINLPWSNVSASRHLMYDSSILTKAVNITFELVPAQNLFLVTAGDAGSVNSTLPTSYKAAYLMCNSAILAKGPIASIRNSVSALGDSRYTFPFMYPSAFRSQPFVGLPKSSGKGQNSVFLNNFRSGSVQSMDLALIRTSLADVSGNIGASLSGTWFGDNLFSPLVEVEIKYGGQTILRSPDQIQQMFNLSNYTTSDSFSVNQFNLTTAALAGNGLAATGVRSTWLHVQLSQLNEAYITNLIQDGVQLQNNMMEVVFNTPEISSLSNGQTGATGVGATPIDPNSTPAYMLLVNYNYQTSVSTYKGFTDFVFVNPAVAAGPYTMAT